VVVSAVPFQSTVDADTNPVPLTVKVTPVEPGWMLTGETISTKGTAFGEALTLAAGNRPPASARIPIRSLRKRRYSYGWDGERRWADGMEL
jgi:hypothetical protein